MRVARTPRTALDSDTRRGFAATQLPANNARRKPSEPRKVARLHQSVFKKALADEHECLLCLKLCVEAEDGGLRLVEHPSGLFTVSVCVMSNFSKSRVLALQLLTKMCTINQGHKQVILAS